MSDQTAQRAFEAMFRSTSGRVYAYARRHADADVAEDVVGEVYLVAWRRRTDVPAEPLPWLLVTARNVLHRYWRHRSRQQRLAAELAGIEALAAASDASADDRLALAASFGQLSEGDRETLLLVGWDGLTPREAARVVGCSANTFAARLSRARRRLATLTGDASSLTGDASTPVGDGSPQAIRTPFLQSVTMPTGDRP